MLGEPIYQQLRPPQGDYLFLHELPTSELIILLH